MLCAFFLVCVDLSLFRRGYSLISNNHINSLLLLLSWTVFSFEFMNVRFFAPAENHSCNTNAVHSLLEILIIRIILFNKSKNNACRFDTSSNHLDWMHLLKSINLLKIVSLKFIQCVVCEMCVFFFLYFGLFDLSLQTQIPCSFSRRNISTDRM